MDGVPALLDTIDRNTPAKSDVHLILDDAGIHKAPLIQLRCHIATTSEHPKPFAWAKAADEILASVGRFCRRTSASHRSRI